MPSDIRAFFGGGGGAAAAKVNPATPEKPSKRGRSRKVVSEDDDEDFLTVKKETLSRKQTKQPSAPPKQEETTADDYFGKGSKPKRSEDVRPASRIKVDGDEMQKGRESAKATPPKKGQTKEMPSRSSTRKTRGNTAYLELDEDQFSDDVLMDEGRVKTPSKNGRNGVVQDGHKEAATPKTSKAGKSQKVKADEESDFEPDDDDAHGAKDDDEHDTPVLNGAADSTRRSAKSGGRKRKSPVIDEGDDDDLAYDEAKPAKKRATPVKRTATGKAKAAEPQNSAAMQAIFDSIPTILAPPPPEKIADSDGRPRFQYGHHANSAVPAGALDDSDIPTGAENCLAGLTFVFTGQLQRLGREQGQNLVKRYGGKVTLAPSKKTSYVVLGEDAGPKKLETIRNFGLKSINEDGLFALIRNLPANGGDSAAAEKQAELRAKEEQAIRKEAELMEKMERAQIAAAEIAKPKVASGGAQAQDRPSESKGKASATAPDTRLWTVRYAPQQVSQICGNKAQVEKLQRWLRAFPKNQRTKFKLPGPDGSGTFRAVMIHGPPGIGKTTAAHLVAKLEGYDIVESNASDTRSKKLVETGLTGVLSATSLMGYFGTSSHAEAETAKKKLVLIMDEVDGMSAGDRGGVGALASVCKKTQIPMILICNDRKLPKMKPFDFVTYDLAFRRPTVDQIRSRMSTIAFREGLKIPPNVINALIEGSGADIRQVVNMISTAKLDAKDLTYEEGKDMSKSWEKHIILKPWDMVSKILGGGLFNPSSKSTLNDKQELYFNDHEFAPLMLQENYLGTNPQRSNKYNDKPRMKGLAQLDLACRAADAISEGDLVDRMIHGSQQQWSLMPTHAMFSFVRPASFVYGTQAGSQTRFTAWLGKNSNQGKNMRLIKEIQGHMRLRISADRHEVRQTYLPLLFDRLIRRLQSDGKVAVQNVIELMDEYYLTKDDWDAILELGVGKDDMDSVKVDSQTKSAFTRAYNQQSHPMPFMKASQVVAPKRGVAKEKPDLEEAIDDSDEEIAPADDPEADAKEDDDKEADLSKDKYVKQPKKKAPGASKAGPSKKRARNDEGEESEPEERAKKTKGKGRATK